MITKKQKQLQAQRRTIRKERSIKWGMTTGDIDAALNPGLMRTVRLVDAACTAFLARPENRVSNRRVRDENASYRKPLDTVTYMNCVRRFNVLPLDNFNPELIASNL